MNQTRKAGSLYLSIMLCRAVPYRSFASQPSPITNIGSVWKIGGVEIARKNDAAIVVVPTCTSRVAVGTK